MLKSLLGNDKIHKKGEINEGESRLMVYLYCGLLTTCVDDNVLVVFIELEGIFGYVATNE